MTKSLCMCIHLVQTHTSSLCRFKPAFERPRFEVMWKC